MKSRVNQDILQAAFVDGASFHQTFLRIVVPLCKRGMMTAAIFIMVFNWNELLFVLLLSQSESSRTIQVAIRYFLASFAADYPKAFAAVVMATIPMVIVYMIFNNKIVEGLSMGVE